GETLYAFIPRSLAGQAAEAWRFEASRLRRAGARAFGLKNRVVAYALAEAALALGLAVWSPRAVLFLLADAAIAATLLEGFNYVAHYGLERRLGPDGRPEPLQPRHSWTTGRRANNAALYNMGRHADHHRFAARAYETLEAAPGAAELPCGYACALLMALVPPLWRRVMDPLAERAMARGGPAPERQKATA
ncbi:MAG: fatty acid desaturase, partial [Caulobacteraceae bacterium]